jgi:hypothetical protein
LQVRGFPSIQVRFVVPPVVVVPLDHRNVGVAKDIENLVVAKRDEGFKEVLEKRVVPGADAAAPVYPLCSFDIDCVA